MDITMNSRIKNRRKQGFTLIELLVVVLILGILMNVTLPSYLSSVYTARMGAANANARALATAVQAKGIITQAYDTTLANYAIDMGGSLPLNPCTGTSTGYAITVTGSTAKIVASAGTNCGTWTPTQYSVSR